ncbi:MAG: hypothetical protein U9R79_09650 [Armatimonadota bacterium]|nr:hypothetical protein [Armatimonadota bacterium]
MAEDQLEQLPSRIKHPEPDRHVPDRETVEKLLQIGVRGAAGVRLELVGYELLRSLRRRRIGRMVAGEARWVGSGLWGGGVVVAAERLSTQRGHYLQKRA